MVLGLCGLKHLSHISQSGLDADFSSWVWFFPQPGGDQTEFKKSYEAFAHLMEFFLPFVYL